MADRDPLLIFPRWWVQVAAGTTCVLVAVAVAQERQLLAIIKVTFVLSLVGGGLGLIATAVASRRSKPTA